jgi:hypothetical protein
VANRRASARPMPDAPPVTTATLPVTWSIAATVAPNLTARSSPVTRRGGAPTG